MKFSPDIDPKFNQLSDDQSLFCFGRTRRNSCSASKFLMLNRNKFLATFRQVQQTLEGVSTHKQTATEMLSIVARKYATRNYECVCKSFHGGGKYSDSQRPFVRRRSSIQKGDLHERFDVVELSHALIDEHVMNL